MQFERFEEVFSYPAQSMTKGVRPREARPIYRRGAGETEGCSSADRFVLGGFEWGGEGGGGGNFGVEN